MGKHRCETCDGFGFVSPKSRRWYEFWKSEPCAEVASHWVYEAERA